MVEVVEVVVVDFATRETVNVGPTGPRGEAEVDAMHDHCSGRGEGGVKGTQNTGWWGGGEDILSLSNERS